MDKLKGLTIADHILLEAEKTKAMKAYFKAGYKQPTYALTLIADVYNQRFAKETEKAQREGKDGLSERVQETFEVLKTLTETKLYTEAAQSLKNGEDFVLSFKKGIPDEQTANFFNVNNSVSHNLNITRTDAIRLPENIHAESSYEVVVTPDGDWAYRDGTQVFAPADPFITQVAIESLGLEQE